jgi:hypothetical protein
VIAAPNACDKLGISKQPFHKEKYPMFTIAAGIILAVLFLAIAIDFTLALILLRWSLWIAAAAGAFFAWLLHFYGNGTNEYVPLMIGITAASAIAAYLTGMAEDAIKNARIRKVQAQFKTCPRCAEIVKAQAAVCKHCGHEF